MKLFRLRNILLAGLAMFSMTAPALADDELIILGSKEAHELAEDQQNFFKDKGVPFIRADITDFDQYRDNSVLFIFAQSDSPILDELLGADSGELAKLRKLKSSLYENIGDKFVPGQNIFLFVGNTPRAAFAISKDTKDDWWPLLGNLFDIKILQDEIFAY